MAVLIGLVFLAFEIRQNTNVARASAYREHVQDIADWRATFATNPQLSKEWEKYRELGPETPAEDMVNLSWLLNNIMASYENAFYSWRLDIIGDDEWQRFRDAGCFHWQIQGRAKGDSLFLSDEFEEYMNQTCAADSRSE
jgi:hypothetical protein